MRANRPRGATLLELLVVVSVLSILTGLALPAVQSAREAMRSLACRSNLAQLAKAAHLYHDTHGTLPGWQQTGESSDPQVLAISYPSIQAQLLPFLEGQAAYELLNFNRPIHHEFVAEFGGYWPNTTAAAIVIPGFLCPSDGGTTIQGGINYRANWGVGPMWHQTALHPDSQNGAFASANTASVYPVKLAAITDGLSRTAMFSERVRGSGGGKDRFRDMVYQGLFEVAGVGNADAERQYCAALNETATTLYAGAGSYWPFSGMHQTIYVHTLAPNSGISDCIAVNFALPLGCASARSRHPGSVNIAFADGSARSVGESVALLVWRAWGSRNGREVVSEE